MANLKIGQLAGLTDTSADALRYYESEGLLPKPKQTPAGYRIYGDADVERVNFIRRSRGMGFSLKDISELMTLSVERESSTCGDVKLVAEKKLAAIEEKFLELQKMKAALQQVTDACVGGGESAVHCSILNALAVERTS